MPSFQTGSGHPYNSMMPAPVSRAYIDAAYGQMHYHYAGTLDTHGIPVVLLHMSPKCARQWRQVMSYLSAEYYCLAPDYPGYGESDPSAAEPHVAIYDYANAVWQFIDALNLDRVYLAGIHTGSMVAVEMARLHPERVARMVQFSAPMYNDEEITALRDLFADPLPLDDEGSRYTIMWQRLLEHKGPQASLTWAAWSMRDNVMGGEAYEWGHRAAFDYAAEYNQRLLTVSQPMLVVNPADSCHDATRRFAEACPAVAYIEKPEWQGAGFLDYNAEAVALLLADFFSVS